MSYTVSKMSLDELNSCWTDSRQTLDWSCLFVLPAWLQVWWQTFGSEHELMIRTIRQGEKIIGIAPLMVKGEKALLIGDTDVCDYQDFIVAPGMEEDFFNTLLDDLNKNSISELDLKHVRPDSTVLTNLVATATGRGYKVVNKQEDISLEVNLPSSWDEYLAILNTKQRHEVKRKLRRLGEAGKVDHRCLDAGQELQEYLALFLRLFPMSREDKASFMTPKMELFFQDLAKAMADIGLLRFGIVELDDQPIAMTLGFDYKNTHFLYNSAYDPRFNYLSAGLLCKVLCLKESIEKGKKKWDFLKGAEPYKYHLGGQEIPLYRCQISIR
jgi:CelD/BcsL family acetyltransferase involved in cellulose biosynthesis